MAVRPLVLNSERSLMASIKRHPHPQLPPFLVRKSPDSSHLVFLDHIRGVAILMVFVFHCLGVAFQYDQLPWDGWWRTFERPASFLALLPITFGWVGVPVFFVVSGFCIHLSHSRSPDPRISVFYLRRLFRIYPPYLVALLIFSFLPPWRYIPLNDPESVTQFLSHLFMVHNYGKDTFYGINSTFWSVAVEFHLYLIYPLLLLLAARCGWKAALAATLAAEIGLRGFAAFRFTTGDAEIPYWMIGAPLFYGFSWLIGAAAADAWLKRRPLPFSHTPIWLFPMLVVGTACFKPLAMFPFLFASLAMLPLFRVLLERRDRWSLRTERRFGRHFRFAGIYSYSIYLIHFPIIAMIPKVMEKFLPSLATQPLAVMAACVLAWFPVMAASRVFYQLLEQPCIALGKLAIRKWLPPAAGHTAMLEQSKA